MLRLRTLKRLFPDLGTIIYDDINHKAFGDGHELDLSKIDLNKEILKTKDELIKKEAEIKKIIADDSKLLEGSTKDEIEKDIQKTFNAMYLKKDELPIQIGDILEFQYVENGKTISNSNDKIEEELIKDGFELFCPHSKEEYEKARKYLVNIKKPKGMGPLGIYQTRSGWRSTAPFEPLTSEGIGKYNWAVQDGSKTWWASDIETIGEPNGDGKRYGYLGIDYDDKGYIYHWNDARNYKYSNYLCVKRAK